jgi:hypothetical protein
MAVTLTIADLQYPIGKLQTRLFPDGDIGTALAAWIEEAAKLTGSNEAAAHYVYWRGYSAAADRIAAMPTSQSTGQGQHSQSWSDGRVEQWRNLAREHKAAFDAIVPPSAPVADATGHSGQGRVIATW